MLGVGFANACSGAEVAQSSSAALHGVGLPSDTIFKAVVDVSLQDGSGCSASLLTDNIAILAAHCMPQVAHNCRDSVTETSFPGSIVTLSIQGRKDMITQTYTVDRVAPHPASFLNLETCLSSAPNNCASGGGNENLGAARGHDIALVHFIVGAGQTAPSGYTGMTFRPVITSVADSNTSPVGTIHVPLNMPTAITSTTNAWIVGWGADDFPLLGQGGTGEPGLRLAGTMQFQGTGSTFTQNCEQMPTCWNTLNPSVSCSGNTGFFADNIIPTHRWGTPGSYTGAAIGQGDSGGPLLLHAGTGAGDVPSLVGISSADYYQIGITSAADVLLPDGVVIDAGTQVNDSFAPTWTPDNGGWIEKTIKDFLADQDGDGITTGDTCPTIPNTDQSNSNAIAEAAFVLPAQGDACDANATTRGLFGGEWNSPYIASCTQVLINGTSGVHYTTTSGGTCPLVFNTNVTMRGNIGNGVGNALSAAGTSIPSYCDCPFANSSLAANCATAPFNCVVASDNADRYLPNPLTTGWHTITQYSGGVDHLYNWQPTTHQDPSDWQILKGLWQNHDVQSTWDYIADTAALGHPGAVMLLGQMWTHLPPAQFVPAAGETTPAPNTPSHYMDFLAKQHHGLTYGVVPPLMNRFVPFWVKVIAPGPEVPFVLVGSEAAGAIDVLAETASGPRMLNANFDPSALTALSSVASWTGDLLVADESVANIGPVSPSTPRAIVTWTNDTSIQSALTQQFQVLTGATTSNPNTFFAASARAYSATAGKLFAIKNAGGWKLYAFDVPSALAGTPTSTNVSITGVTPATPTAMAFDMRDGNLYVVDYIPVGAATGIRLFRLTPTGVATELWRTTGDVAPSVYLSVSSIGELVLGLTIVASKTNEALLLDTYGHPWWSTSSTGLLLGRPVANETGVSIARTDSAGRAATSTLLVARPSLTHGLCGSTWLKAHVDATVAGPLGYPGGDCP